MSFDQIAALVCAILLLLPGGCFLFYGIGFANSDLGSVLLLIAALILALAGFLFRAAFRRRRPDRGSSPDAPPS